LSGCEGKCDQVIEEDRKINTDWGQVIMGGKPIIKDYGQLIMGCALVIKGGRHIIN
jgi:hypothetical protein